MTKARKPVDDSGEAIKALAAATVSTGDLAREFGKSPVWIRNLINAGFIPKLAHGRVNRVAAYRGIIAYEESLVAKAEERAQSSGRARMNAARAGEIEARLAREMRGLIERREAEDAISEVVALAVKEMRAFGPRLPRALPRDAVKAEIAASCARMEKARDVLIGALRTGDLDGCKP